jgi:hypothetical protein
MAHSCHRRAWQVSQSIHRLRSKRRSRFSWCFTSPCVKSKACCHPSLRRSKAHAQGHGGGDGTATSDRFVAVCDPGRGTRGRGDEARALIVAANETRAVKRHGHTDPRGRRRCPAWRESRRLIEWCRPPGALPSRMRDRGGDIVPPDVRFAGKCPAVTRAPPWRTIEMPRRADTTGTRMKT